MSAAMKQSPISDPGRRPDLATEPAPLSMVDRSIRIPVLIFLASGVFWLIVASGFWLLSSSQIHTPTAWWTFPGVAWLSFGRAYPAFLNCFIYGWASCAGIGVGIWLLARFSRVPLRNPFYPILSAATWNIGIAVGVFSILAGATTGKQMLEFPARASFILFLALVMVVLWALATFWDRRAEPASISQWYILGAFLWFVWMYSTANILLNFAPAPGPAQPAINWWYIGSLIDLWLTPIALGTAYYLIPKLVGRPVYSYQLALLGFWTLALFGGWTGMTHLIGGPLPAWMITASIVARVLMILPILAVATNFHLTMKGKLEDLSWNPALRFVVIGTMVYTVYGFQGALLSTRTIAQVTQFTFVTFGNAQLALFGFYSMILFGAYYYIVPRLLDRQWLSHRLITAHFWVSVVGLGLLVFALTMGGLIQGFGLQNPQISMRAVSDLLWPFLLFQNIAVLLLVLANLGFAFLFTFILMISVPMKRRFAAIESLADAPKKIAPEVSVA
jgi:cytochrome c oxidase cbb3-type subunit I